MPVKLLKSKWYVVNLDTRCVDIRRHYERFWTAVETARAEGLHHRFTAMTGKHILKHTNVWIIPLAVEEAFDEYINELLNEIDQRPTEEDDPAHLDKVGSPKDIELRLQYEEAKT